jgi:arylsulfatase A-like enzyme
MGEDVNNDCKNFADDVAYMDKLVGKLVAELDAEREKTLIIFWATTAPGGRLSRSSATRR